MLCLSPCCSELKTPRASPCTFTATRPSTEAGTTKKGCFPATLLAKRYITHGVSHTATSIATFTIASPLIVHPQMPTIVVCAAQPKPGHLLSSLGVADDAPVDPHVLQHVRRRFASEGPVALGPAVLGSYLAAHIKTSKKASLHTPRTNAICYAMVCIIV